MLLHFLVLLPVVVTSEMTSTMDHVKNSGNGSFDGTFAFRITEEVVGWEAVITFSTSVNGLTVCIQTFLCKYPPRKTWIMKRKCKQ